VIPPRGRPQYLAEPAHASSRKGQSVFITVTTRTYATNCHPPSSCGCVDPIFEAVLAPTRPESRRRGAQRMTRTSSSRKCTGSTGVTRPCTWPRRSGTTPPARCSPPVPLNAGQPSPVRRVALRLRSLPSCRQLEPGRAAAHIDSAGLGVARCAFRTGRCDALPPRGPRPQPAASPRCCRAARPRGRPTGKAGSTPLHLAVRTDGAGGTAGARSSSSRFVRGSSPPARPWPTRTVKRRRRCRPIQKPAPAQRASPPNDQSADRCIRPCRPVPASPSELVRGLASTVEL